MEHFSLSNTFIYLSVSLTHTNALFIFSQVPLFLFHSRFYKNQMKVTKTQTFVLSHFHYHMQKYKKKSSSSRVPFYNY